METIPAPLRGKIAIVTGGSRGIGAAIAKTLAIHGCSHIAITYNSNKSMAEDVQADIAKVNSKIKTTSFATDVSDPQSGDYIVEQSLKGLGVDHLDIVVCGAALANIKSFPTVESLTIDTFNHYMTANAFTPFALTRAASKVMPPGGRIIHLSSGASKMPVGDPLIMYSASKSALDSISKNMAAVFGAEGKEITVNAISIGPIYTDALREGIDHMGPEYEKTISDLTLRKKIGRPQEVADIVAFIASPGAINITGNQIPANGGVLATLQG